MRRGPSTTSSDGGLSGAMISLANRVASGDKVGYNPHTHHARDIVYPFYPAGPPPGVAGLFCAGTSGEGLIRWADTRLTGFQRQQ